MNPYLPTGHERNGDAGLVRTPDPQKWYDYVRARIRSLAGRAGQRSVRIGLLGALGHYDIGDESMCWAVRTFLLSFLPDADLRVFSADPEATTGYLGVPTVPTLYARVMQRGRITDRLLVAAERAGSYFARRQRRRMEGRPRSGLVRMLMIRRLVRFEQQVRAFCDRRARRLRPEWRSHLDDLSGLDAVILLGGGYLNSWHVSPRHLYSWLMTYRALELLGIPILSGSLNLGPLDAIDRTWVARALAGFEVIGLRDWRESLAELSRMEDCRRVRVLYSSDHAMRLASDPLGDRGLEDLVRTRQPYLIVQMHPWLLEADAQQRLVSLVADALDRLVASRTVNLCMTSFLFAPVPLNRDAIMLARVRDCLKHRDAAFDAPRDLRPPQMKYLLAHGAGVVCTRHHPFVFALGAGVRSLAICYDRYYAMKLEGVLPPYADLGRVRSIHAITAASLATDMASLLTGAAAP